MVLHFMLVSRLDHPLYEAELVLPPKASPRETTVEGGAPDVSSRSATTRRTCTSSFCMQRWTWWRSESGTHQPCT
jgi:hypothetical protein